MAPVLDKAAPEPSYTAHKIYFLMIFKIWIYQDWFQRSPKKAKATIGACLISYCSVLPCP